MLEKQYAVIFDYFFPFFFGLPFFWDIGIDYSRLVGHIITSQVKGNGLISLWRYISLIIIIIIIIIISIIINIIIDLFFVNFEIAISV